MPATKTFTYNTEQSLVTSMLLGSKAALDDMYHKYGPLLMGFILNIVEDSKIAEEILQQSFVDIWKRRSEYKPEAERLFTWMLRLTRAKTLSKAPVKQNIINEEILNSNIVVNIDGTLNAEYQGSQAEKQAYLTGLQETVFKLIYVNGYSVAEVASTVKIAADDVKRTLRSAMNQVKTVQHG